jgi:hypothetical protein
VPIERNGNIVDEVVLNGSIINEVTVDGAAVYSDAAIPANGLELHLAVRDNNSYSGSGNTWFDISGNGRDHNANATFTQFNGIDAFKTLNSENIFPDYGQGPTITSTFTYIGWAVETPESGTWRTLFRTVPDDHPLLVLSGGTDIGSYENGDANFRSSGLDVVNDNARNQWTMYTVRGNSDDTMTFYLDRRRATGSIDENHVSGNEHFAIGGNSTGPSQEFPFIGEVLLYNRALSDAEIDDVYDSTKEFFQP